MEVYVDLYFLINSGIDFLCLLITGMILQRPLSVKRLLPAAILGGIWSCASLFLSLSGFFGVSLDLLVGFLLSVLSFWKKGGRFRRLWADCAVFLTVSFTLGGVMTGLFSLFNRLHLPFASVEEDSLPVLVFAVLSLVSGFFTFKGVRFRGKLAKRKYADLRFRFCGRQFSVRTLVDSGNLLQDPVTGKSVILLDKTVLAPLSPIFSEPTAGTALYEKLSAEEKLNGKFRLIPAKTATGTGMLPAFSPEEAVLTVKNRSTPVAMLIALSSFEKGSDCQAVAPPIL